MAKGSGYLRANEKIKKGSREDSSENQIKRICNMRLREEF